MEVFDIKQIAKFWISTSTLKKNKKWYKILINGQKAVYSINKDGVVINRTTGREMSTTRNTNRDNLPGYVVYQLSVDHKVYHVFKHRLMASIFIPIP